MFLGLGVNCESTNTATDFSPSAFQLHSLKITMLIQLQHPRPLLFGINSSLYNKPESFNDSKKEWNAKSSKPKVIYNGPETFFFCVLSLYAWWGGFQLLVASLTPYAIPEASMSLCVQTTPLCHFSPYQNQFSLPICHPSNLDLGDQLYFFTLSALRFCFLQVRKRRVLRENPLGLAEGEKLH